MSGQFIKWEGGPCPIEKEHRYDVRFDYRGEAEFFNKRDAYPIVQVQFRRGHHKTMQADQLLWNHDGRDPLNDIIAYRVLGMADGGQGIRNGVRV